MGWTEAEFYAASPRYFFNAWRSHQKKWDAEAKERENWNHWHLKLNRQAALYAINLQLTAEHQFKSEHDFFPLPWDEIPEPKQAADIAKEAADFIKEMGYDQGIPANEFFK